MLPEPSAWDIPIVLMAIDPGSSNLGVAIYEVCLQTRNILQSHAYTIYSTQSSYYFKEDAKLYGDRLARMNALQAELAECLQRHNPSIVLCESPFFNRLMPSAFGVLNEVMIHVKQALRDYNEHIPFFTVDPPTAKKAVGAKGNAKKDDMTLAIEKQLPQLKLMNAVSELDEHAIDALAIGYYGYKQYVIGDVYAKV